MNFPQKLHDALSESDVLLAIIGEQWLEVREHGRRRLDDPHDYVRREIEMAFTRGIPVIPVLIDRTPMPPVEVLPPTLAQLVECQAIRIDPGQDFHAHVDRLIRGL